MSSNSEVIKALNRIKNQIVAVVNIRLDDAFVFDFTEKNRELQSIELSNTKEFTRYIFRKIRENNGVAGIGRYNENRTIYARSGLFAGAGSEPRTVHLGIDLWAKAGTPIFAPLSGMIHSFRNNKAFGDYGPTIILEHNVDGVVFYTLYGHLSIDSIKGLRVGQGIDTGDEIAHIGNYPENGSWPPHLHFQLITNMQGRQGDFPGVAGVADRERFLELCPDPNIILGMRNLK